MLIVHWQTPPVAFWVSYLLPAVGSVAGTWILWRRRRPRKDDKPIPMAAWAKAAWIIASQAALFLLGFYLPAERKAIGARLRLAR